MSNSLSFLILVNSSFKLLFKFFCSFNCSFKLIILSSFSFDDIVLFSVSIVFNKFLFSTSNEKSWVLICSKLLFCSRIKTSFSVNSFCKEDNCWYFSNCIFLFFSIFDSNSFILDLRLDIIFSCSSFDICAALSEFLWLITPFKFVISLFLL